MGQTTIERDRPPPLSTHGDAALVRAIGLGGATLLVIGNVIGSAIFLTSGTMASTEKAITERCPCAQK